MDTSYVNNVTLDKDKMTVRFNKSSHSEVLLKIFLSDKKNHYLPYANQYVIPANVSDHVWEQPILLMTKSGDGCVGAPDVNSCFAN